MENNKRILRAQIEDLERQLEDMPAFDNRRETVSACIHDLNITYADLFPVPGEISTQSVPSFGKFDYHKILDWREVESLGVGSHQFMCRDSTNLYTLVVDKKGERRELYRGYPETEQVLLVKPVDSVEYTEKASGEAMVACLYPYMESLKDAMAKGGFSDGILRSFLRCLIMILHYLENSGRAPCDIGVESLVCSPGHVGCLLYRPAASAAEFTHSFTELQEAVSKNVPSSIQISPTLTNMLTCMSLAWSIERRRRLLQAPCLLTDGEKVYNFINTIFSAVEDVQSYKVYINDKLLVAMRKWKHIVSNKIEKDSNNYGELEQIMSKNMYGQRGSEFVRFLRNSINHLNELKVEQEMKKEEDSRRGKGKKEKGKSAATPPSVLLSNTRLLLDLMDDVDDGFLDHMFLYTYDVVDMDNYRLGAYLATDK